MARIVWKENVNRVMRIACERMGTAMYIRGEEEVGDGYKRFKRERGFNLGIFCIEDRA